jgi:hypothetical protein
LQPVCFKVYYFPAAWRTANEKTIHDYLENFMSANLAMRSMSSGRARYFRPTDSGKWYEGKTNYLNMFGPMSVWHVTGWRKSIAYYLFCGDKDIELPSLADDRETMTMELVKSLSRNKNIYFKSQEHLIQECRKQAFAGVEKYLASRKERSNVTDEQRLRWRLANEKRERVRCQHIWETIKHFFETLGRKVVSINEIAKASGSHWLTVRKVMREWKASKDR